MSAAAKSQQRFWRPERQRAAARPQRGARSSERLAKVAFEVQGSQQNPTQNTVGSGWTKRGKPEEGGSAWRRSGDRSGNESSQPHQGGRPRQKIGSRCRRALVVTDKGLWKLRRAASRCRRVHAASRETSPLALRKLESVREAARVAGGAMVEKGADRESAWSKTRWKGLTAAGLQLKATTWKLKNYCRRRPYRDKMLI